MFLALLVYVGEIVIATNNKNEAVDLKIFLNSHFKLKDCGTWNTFWELKLQNILVLSLFSFDIMRYNYSQKQGFWNASFAQRLQMLI